jgi:anti-sigma factor RsiW
MSLPPDTMLDLMALADGELQGEARERAEKLVAQNEEARRLVEHMRSPALGSLLEEAMSQHAAVAGADGIADAVMARLERRDEAPAAVVRLADARAKRGVPSQLVVATIGVLAVAAAVALYLRSNQEGPDVRSPVASVGGSSVDVQVPPTTLAQAARPAQDVEIDQLESEHDITVFSIPLGGAAAAAIPGNPSSVVIMIEDDPGPQ